MSYKIVWKIDSHSTPPALAGPKLRAGFALSPEGAAKKIFKMLYKIGMPYGV